MPCNSQRLHFISDLILYYPVTFSCLSPSPSMLISLPFLVLLWECIRIQSSMFLSYFSHI